MSLNLARATNSTSNIVTLFAWDITNKKPKTGLLYNTSGLVVYTALNQAAAASIGTLVDMTEGTFTSLGFKEKASLPGFYDVGVPNTKFASVTGELLITARITSDDTIVFQPVCIPILPASAYATTVDANVTKWSGTNVASPDTAGYPKVTLKSGTGAGEVSLSSGVASADVKKMNGTTVNGAGTSGNKWRG